MLLVFTELCLNMSGLHLSMSTTPIHVVKFTSIFGKKMKTEIVNRIFGQENTVTKAARRLQFQFENLFIVTSHILKAYLEITFLVIGA